MERYQYAAPTSELTDESARDHYVHVLLIAQAYGLDATAVRGKASTRLAYDGIEDPTPVDWVEAALTVTNKCDRCTGTGVFAWGTFVNGKPSKTGICFHCHGSGKQDHSDRKRCIDYCAFGMRVS